MKRLIYTVARGNPVYLEMARELVFSARKHGFNGDIRVLTDRKEKVEGAECLEVDTSPDQLAKAALIRALPRVEIESYDRILFVDADCVFRKSPDVLFDQGGLRIATEAMGPLARYNQIFLTREEAFRFRQMRIPRVNSGTILMPGRIAFEFLQGWEAFWEACPREEIRQIPWWSWCNPSLMDQPALQALLFRGGWPWAPFDEGSIGFPLFAPAPQAALLHFCGPLNGGETPPDENKAIVLARMKGKNRTGVKLRSK